tara:strand:+ start:10412 stop:11257 length:846 start_codon:yes stop_codon:yes gene_type:complete
MGGYIDSIECPKLVPISKMENAPIEFAEDNVKAMSEYALGYFVSGTSMFDSNKDLSLGENYWLDSGLMCDEEKSDVDCIGKTQKTYIRNIPTGTIPGLNISFVDLTGTNIQGITEMRGVVPGILEDVADINPLTLVEGVLGYGNYGSTKCKKISMPVGTKIYNSSYENKTWKWDTQCSASYLSSVPTSSLEVNQKIASNNDSISVNKRGSRVGLGIPAGLGFSYEEFKNKKKSRLLAIITFITFILCSLYLVIIIRLNNIFHSFFAFIMILIIFTIPGYIN